MALVQGDTGIVGDAGTGNNGATVIDDTTNPTTERRLQTESRLAPGSTVSIVPPITNVSDLFRAFLENTVPSDDMLVDGSSAPVVFKVVADATDEITLIEIRIVFTANQLDWGGTTFGSRGGALTNGILIEVDVGGTVTEIGVIKINEDILQLPVRNDVLLGQAGNRDVLALSIDFGSGVVLEAGSSDEVRATIRDDLTAAPRHLNYLKMSTSGAQTPP